MASASRSLKFKKRQEPRFGWFRVCGNYVPFTLSYLTDSEWKIIDDWFKDTEKESLIGESSTPFMSFIQGLIMGNDISRIVQLGHYAGFSSLLIGFMLRKMKRKNGLFSIDIDQFISDYSEKWIKKAKLQEYIKIHTSDSANPKMPGLAQKYLGGKPEMVIIDSSHQYEHTRRELDLWYPKLEHGGFLILHDSSPFADSFDSTKKGGVRRALVEWAKENKVQYLNIYPRLDPKEQRVKGEKLIYKDPCGITVIQK